MQPQLHPMCAALIECPLERLELDLDAASTWTITSELISKARWHGLRFFSLVVNESPWGWGMHKHLAVAVSILLDRHATHLEVCRISNPEDFEPGEPIIVTKPLQKLRVAQWEPMELDMACFYLPSVKFLHGLVLWTLDDPKLAVCAPATVVSATVQLVGLEWSPVRLPTATNLHFDHFSDTCWDTEEVGRLYPSKLKSAEAASPEHNQDVANLATYGAQRPHSYWRLQRRP